MKDNGAERRPGRRRIVASFLLAAGINALVFVMLSALGRPVAPETVPIRRPAPAFTVTHRIVPEKPDQPAQERSASEREFMTVDLDMPAPQPLDVEPVDIDFTIPVVPVALTVVAAVPPARKAKASPPSAVVAAPEEKGPPAPLNAERVDEPPRELANPQPPYPRDALKRGIEGLVVTKLLISERGRVESVRILEVKGPASFERSVLEAAPRMRFVPAKHKGRAVKVWTIKRFRFEMEG